MSDDLILVNARNRAIGRAEKRKVHELGLLHRAFSIFLVDHEGRILLQQRHPAKYHSGGLWTNSCCGHPHPGEPTASAAQRRLGEELGVGSRLRFGFPTRYGTTFANGLIENEIVYVYFGLVPPEVTPAREEISAVKFTPLEKLERDIKEHPENYSFWLGFYVARHIRELKEGIDAVLQGVSAPASVGRQLCGVRA